MEQTCTHNDLLRFIYRETTLDEELAIKTQIAENPALAEEFRMMMETVNELDSISLEPSETSINIILDASREMVEEESHAWRKDYTGGSLITDQEEFSVF